MGETLRLRVGILVAGAFLVGVLAPVASQAEEGASWTDKITLGLHLRARNETRLNYDRNSEVGDKDNFTLLRARLTVDAKPVDEVRAFFQPQASRVMGDSDLTGSPFGPGNAALGIESDDEDFTVHQAFGDLEIFDDTILRVGRQEMSFGDERLVGSFGWNNRGRSFDGFSLIRDTGDYKGHAFLHILERRPPAFDDLQNDAVFTGLHLTMKEVGNGVDTYLLIFIDSDGAACAASSSCVDDENLIIYTLGLRTKDMPQEGVGYDLEGALQFGDNDARDIAAFALHLALGYGLGGDMNTNFLLEYNVASGDGGTGDDNAFKNLFPTNHTKYGYIDFMGWSNMHNFRLGLGTSPTDNLSLSADWHLFAAYDAEGAIGAGAAARAALPGRSERLFGNEFDVLANYKFHKVAKILAGWSLFLPGGMFLDNEDDPVNFLYVQLQIDV